MKEKIKALLEEKGVSLYRACKDSGIPWTTFHYWLEGKMEPSARNLYKLSQYFGVPMEYFVGDDDE